MYKRVLLRQEMLDLAGNRIRSYPHVPFKIEINARARAIKCYTKRGKIVFLYKNVVWSSLFIFFYEALLFLVA